jgi:hypothetical protein
MDDWTWYMDGLPNVMVHELEINYTSQKLVAATYGRGIWQTDLAEFTSPSITTNVIEDTYCPAEELNISYSATGAYYLGNIFTAELSDETGSFTSPVEIGISPSTAATGVITCSLPATLDFGNKLQNQNCINITCNHRRR